MKTKKDDKDLEKSTPHIVIEIINYVPDAIVSKTILKKPTGSVIVTAFDAGEDLAKKTCPFDTYVQIIEGTAEIQIKGKKFVLKMGDGIIIPAHARHEFSAVHQFKMISTVIKSGYEDVSLS